MSATFASLKVRNFRLYFTGQLVSITGTWLQSTAQGWLVLKELDGGADALGLVMGATMLPTLLFGLYAGVIADRFDRRRVVLATSAWQLVTAAALGVLTLTGAVELWMVFALAFLTGMANSVEMPTRQAFTTELVGAELLPNAVGLNSATFNGGRVFGPALAGLLIVLVGTGWCFVFNAVSFLAVMVGLLAVRPAELVPVRRPPRGKGMIREGLAYSWASPVLRSTLLVVFVVGLLTLNFTVVLPAIAKDVFGGDAGLVGVFSATQGAGALVASIFAARRAAPTERLFVGSTIALGVTMTAVGLAPVLWLCLVAVFATGMSFLTMMLTANARLQLNSTMERRGRVMALYVLMFGGTTPFGSPTIGWICDHLGARWGALVGGAAALVAAVTVPLSTRAAQRRAERHPGEFSSVVPAPS